MCDTMLITGAASLLSLLPLLLLLNTRTADGASTAAVALDSAAGSTGRLGAALDVRSQQHQQQPQQPQQQQQQQQQRQQQPVPSLPVEVVSSGRSCEVRVGGRLLLYRHGRHLGLHALALNPRTGRSTGYAAAPGGVPAGAFVELASFVSRVQPGRVIILCQQSEAEMALDETSDHLFRSLNASFAAGLQARSALALVAVKGGAVLAEGYRPNMAALEPDTPAPSLRLAVSVPVDLPSCQQPDSAAERRRRDFCERYDGYGALCECGASPPVVARQPFADGTLFPFPVLVVSGGRPRHLHRCLVSLLANPGLDPTQLLVITATDAGDAGEGDDTDAGGDGGDTGDGGDGSDGVDSGDSGELQNLIRVYGIAWHPISAGPGGGNSDSGTLHRRALEVALHRFPTADKLVLIEDRVEVSPDLLSYFHQTHSLLDSDVSLYGVSGGNELGYRHAVSDRTTVYRVNSAPAGAWLLPRRVVSEDVLPAWTTAAAAAAAAAGAATRAAGVGAEAAGYVEPELSEALRKADVRLGRECVVPEVPRFYRFTFNQTDNGTDYLYHWDRAVSVGPPVTLRGVRDLVLPRYERHLQTLISGATKLDGSHSRLDCSEIVPANATNQTLVLSVWMLSEALSGSWQRAAACLGLWDRDARGHHLGLWRLRHAGGGDLLVIGVPLSPLSGYALLHGRGGTLVVGNERSAGQRRRGRWPPGLERPGPERVVSRYRVSAAAAGLSRHQLEAALVRRGLIHQQDIDGDGDDGDLGLEDIGSA